MINRQTVIPNYAIKQAKYKGICRMKAGDDGYSNNWIKRSRFLFFPGYFLYFCHESGLIMLYFGKLCIACACE